MIAYTAIYGGYDLLKPHPDHPSVSEWICYTDDPQLAHPDWDVRCVTLPFTHPRVSAKWWKCHPPEADTSAWIDGSVNLLDPIYFDVLANGLDEADITMFAHPDRDCIYDEAQVSIGMTKYQGQAILDQVAHYRERGWPPEAGLWASTTFARRHTPNIVAFSAAWFAHCDLLTYQDQLSLPVLLDMYGIKPAPIPGNLWANRWFTISGHTSDL